MPTNRRCQRCCPSGTFHASNNIRHNSSSTTSVSSVNSNAASPSSNCFQWPDFLSHEVFGSLREQIGRVIHFNLGRRPSRTNRRQHLLDQSPISRLATRLIDLKPISTFILVLKLNTSC